MQFKYFKCRLINNFKDLSGNVTLNLKDKNNLKIDKQDIAFSVSPYYLSLAENLKNDPIAKQFIPSVLEREIKDYELGDPLGENKFSPSNRLIHRYKDRALLLVTDFCFTYCRHCFRRHFTSQGNGIISEKDLIVACKYISEHEELKEVLVTGGDPLTLDDDSLLYILKKLRNIRNNLIIRIGTRVPVVLPKRISKSFAKKLGKLAPVWIITQFNHPSEISPQNKRVLKVLAEAGIPVLNQSVLLKGINDDPAILVELSHLLVENRVKPYYLFQGDLAKGTSHFRVPLERGFVIVEEMRKNLSGIAMPLYAVDLPGGGGKIPLERSRIIRKDKEYYYFESLYGGEYKYPVEK